MLVASSLLQVDRGAHWRSLRSRYTPRSPRRWLAHVWAAWASIHQLAMAGKPLADPYITHALPLCYSHIFLPSTHQVA